MTRFPSKFPRDQRDRQKSVEQSRKTVSTKLRVVQGRSIKGRPYSPSRLIYLRKILLGQHTSVYHRHEPHLVYCNPPVSRVSSLFSSISHVYSIRSCTHPIKRKTRLVVYYTSFSFRNKERVTRYIRTFYEQASVPLKISI